MTALRLSKNLGRSFERPLLKFFARLYFKKAEKPNDRGRFYVFRCFSTTRCPAVSCLIEVHMRIIIKKSLIVLLIAALYLCGCRSNNDPINAETSNSAPVVETTEPIPDIESFSGEHYENFEYHFSEVVSAYYVSNGNKTEISKDDPRIIRLLNFIAKSHNDLTEVYETRGIDTELIQSLWLDDPSPMLEINFVGSDDNNDNGLKSAFQLLIRGCGIIYIYHNGNKDLFGDSGLYGEQRWPYLGCVDSDNWNRCRHPKNGEKPWLDLLEIAGF